MATHPYKGTPPRAWFEVDLIAPDGQTQIVELLADTGNPFAVILPSQLFDEFKHRDGPSANTNFGILRGGLLRLAIPGLRDDLTVFGYGSDAVADAIRSSDADRIGLAGLPLLRQSGYGGDANSFWIG